MTYDELIETISLIVENEKIQKTGLTLTYELNDSKYKAFHEQLFYKSNPPDAVFIPANEFEVELGGILVKFIKHIPQTAE
jgi:hypothetical protein